MVKDSEIGNIAAIGPGRPPALFEIPKTRCQSISGLVTSESCESCPVGRRAPARRPATAMAMAAPGRHSLSCEYSTLRRRPHRRRDVAQAAPRRFSAGRLSSAFESSS